MFKIVETLKKSFNLIRNMFREEDIATAQIAQLFGSELLKVQENATTDSGSRPDIVKLNPRQFLTSSPQYQSQKKIQEQQLIQMLQREAEAACPLPEESSTPFTPPPPPPLPTVAENVTPLQVNQVKHQQQSAIFTNSISTDVLERIATSLERIAAKLEQSDIQINKKRARNTKKPKINIK